MQHRHRRHISGGHQWHKERQGTGWLRNNDHSVDERMDDACDCGHTEQVVGHKHGWIGERVEESGQDQWQNVLQVVTVSPEFVEFVEQKMRLNCI